MLAVSPAALGVVAVDCDEEVVELLDPIVLEVELFGVVV